MYCAYLMEKGYENEGLNATHSRKNHYSLAHCCTSTLTCKIYCIIEMALFV